MWKLQLVKAEAIEGRVVERDRTRLPQAFIEGTTAYDYGDLPTGLRHSLEEWCASFYQWDRDPSDWRDEWRP